jgi:hypothetical protein
MNGNGERVLTGVCIARLLWCRGTPATRAWRRGRHRRPPCWPPPRRPPRQPCDTSHSPPRATSWGGRGCRPKSGGAPWNPSLSLSLSLTLSVRLSACVWLLAAGFGVNNGAQFETTIHDTVLSSLGYACKGAQAKTTVFTGHALRVRSSRRPLSAHALSMCVILHTATRTLPQKSCDECLTF